MEYYDNGICPYCQRVLPRRPAQEAKCSQCGNTIFVKNSIFTGAKMLLTEEDCGRMAAIKEERVRRNWVFRFIANEGVTEDEVLRLQGREECTIEEALAKLVSSNIERHKRNNYMGFCRNSMLHLGNIYERFGDKQKALELYLIVCFYDLNGCMNSGIKRFDKELALVAPAVIDWINGLSEEIGLGGRKLRELFISKAASVYDPDMPVAPEKAWTKLLKELPKNEGKAK